MNTVIVKLIKENYSVKLIFQTNYKNIILKIDTDIFVMKKMIYYLLWFY